MAEIDYEAGLECEHDRVSMGLIQRFSTLIYYCWLVPRRGVQLCQLLLGEKLDKTCQCSNWEAR